MHLGLARAQLLPAAMDTAASLGHQLTRRWMMVRKASRIGIWQLNPTR